MDLPRVLIVSAQKNKARDLAKEIGGIFLAETSKIQYFTWYIDNKYYKSQLLLCTSDTLPLEITSDGIEAVVLHYDPKGTENLENYIALVQTLTDADVLLLACENFPGANKRDEVTEWCHIYKFELVDMELSPESQKNMKDDVENENYGMERIIEALQTHTWPNRILKGLNNGRISTSNESDVSDVENQLENIQLNTNRDSSNHMLMESVLDGIMGEENADFGELFGQLMAMKEHAASLSTSNRKATAEQLVTAFWRAMGGDPSEIEDLNE